MRPSRNAWAIQLAFSTSHRSTCYRRHVGCIILNARGHVLATGYNGNAAGMPHCNESVEHRCIGADAPSGTNLDSCEAIHAEQNALLQCRDVTEIHAVYCTTAPCMTCTKLLLNTSCKEIYYGDEYPTSGEHLWRRAGRLWIPFGYTEDGYARAQ